MSITAVLTNNTVAESWATSNQSDSWASQTADGGSITRELGDPTTESQQTVTTTFASGAAKAHMGTWVTVASPEAITIPSGATFGVGNIFGYESLGTLNAYVYYKLSIVVEDTAGDLVFDRAITSTWEPIHPQGNLEELGLNVGHTNPMGGSLSVGLSDFHQISGAINIAVGERLAVEIGIDKTSTNKSGTCSIEYGSHLDSIEDDTLQSGIGTGPFGSCIILPMNFSETYQDYWGAHSEIDIPWINSSELIAWADIGSDWTSAKWSQANRYVNRLNGEMTAQFFSMCWSGLEGKFSYRCRRLFI
jgi:hypothetical protein